MCGSGSVSGQNEKSDFSFGYKKSYSRKKILVNLVLFS